MMMTKKGQMNIMPMLIIVGILFVIMFFGLLMVIGSSTINWVFDEVMPEVTNIGMVGESNVSQATSLALTPVNNVVQNFTWITSILYIFGIIGVFGLALLFKNTGSRWLIGFFFGLMLILIIASIFVSNIYEDFYNDTGEMATRLKEHTALSFLILYSPALMSIVGFLAGIILFSGSGEDGLP